jgi:hypothetical protein
MYLEFCNTRTNTVSALSVRFDVQSTESKWSWKLQVKNIYACLMWPQGISADIANIPLKIRALHKAKNFHFQQADIFWDVNVKFLNEAGVFLNIQICIWDFN